MYVIDCICVDDGPTGVPEEYPQRIGPFETLERAQKVAEAMANERWISGSSIYYEINIRSL